MKTEQDISFLTNLVHKEQHDYINIVTQMGYWQTVAIILSYSYTNESWQTVAIAGLNNITAANYSSSLTKHNHMGLLTS